MSKASLSGSLLTKIVAAVFTAIVAPIVVAWALNKLKVTSGPTNPDTPVNTPSAGDTRREAFLAQWTPVDLNGAEIGAGYVRLREAQRLVTREKFGGPIEITVVARTTQHNIRLTAFNGASVIFNREYSPRQLVMTRPDGTKALYSGTPVTAKIEPLAPNTWYKLRWRITGKGMEVAVNDHVVFQEARKNDLSASKVVGVANREELTSNPSVVDVQELVVRSLPE